MYRFFHFFLFSGSVVLGNDNGRAGGKAGKKAYQQIDKRGRGSAYCRKRFFSDEFSDDDRIRRVI